MARSIEFYHTASGRCPVQDFMNELEGDELPKITWLLEFIEDVPMVPVTHLKKLGGTEGIQ